MNTPLQEAQCPMGCGTTLYATVEGEVICSLSTCPAPGAASKVMALLPQVHTLLSTYERLRGPRPSRHERAVLDDYARDLQEM